MSDVLILSQWNKFQGIQNDPIDFEQPFDSYHNIIYASTELEAYMAKHDIQYIKMSLPDFKAMHGL